LKIICKNLLYKDSTQLKHNDVVMKNVKCIKCSVTKLGRDIISLFFQLINAASIALGTIHKPIKEDNLILRMDSNNRWLTHQNTC